MKLKVMKGLTLIELLVTFAIIGILVLIGIPAFRTYQPSLQLSGTVRDLATDLRYAQQLSVAEQVDHGIRFFLPEKKYQIIKYGATEAILKEKSLPSEINFQQVTGFLNNEAKFNPYGAAKEAGNIVLINTKNRTKTIEVRISGFVKITD